MLEAVTTTVNDREAVETATELRVCVSAHRVMTPTGPNQPTNLTPPPRRTLGTRSQPRQHPHSTRTPVHVVCLSRCAVRRLKRERQQEPRPMVWLGSVGAACDTTSGGAG